MVVVGIARFDTGATPRGTGGPDGSAGRVGDGSYYSPRMEPRSAPLPPERTVRGLYRHHFRSSRRERLFLSSVGFFIAFACARLAAHAIRSGVGPFGNVGAGGIHIHHLVWGILLLLAVGYLWLAEVGTGTDTRFGWLSAVTALLYGVGSALTLDEFALWLKLDDVYWAREGRKSIDAVVLFGSLLSIGFWGGPFLRAVAKGLRVAHVRR